MPQTQTLSDLINEIDTVISNRFAGKTYWIKAEITDVKKQPEKKWCFLKFIEKDGHAITHEMKAVFWSNTYTYISIFERETQQTFTSGLELTCNVRVRFNKRYGIDLEVLAIDFAYVAGILERERKLVLEKLLHENPSVRLLDNGNYSTFNNRMPLPLLYSRIALITAPQSDGQRDFVTVITANKYGYVISIEPFLCQVQGEQASRLMLQQLAMIEARKEAFDVVVMVRGGGSDTDFKPFNDYELVQRIASFPLPVLTGIGHDRNTSIVDLVARQHKTPTEVAGFILDTNYSAEHDLMQLKRRLQQKARALIDNAATHFSHYKQRLINLSPETILKKGFAIVYLDDKIIVDPQQVKPGMQIKTRLQNDFLNSIVTNILSGE